MFVSRRAPVLFSAVVVGLALPVSSRAATLTVCLSGCDHTDIPAAVAASADGDTIEVDAGTWVGTLVIDRAITLIGTSGSAATVIEPDSGNHTVLIGAEVRVEGFEIIPATRRAVRVNSSGTGTLVDILVRDASGSDGVGAEVNAGTMTVMDSVFRNLTSSGNGGCINARGGGDVVLSNVTCATTSATRGGAVAINSASNVSITGLTVTDATATDRGGSLFANTVSNLTLSDSTFSVGIASDRGGHLYLTDISNAAIERTLMEGGEADSGAGAYVVTNSNATFTDTTFLGNIAAVEGGALYSGSAVQITSSTFESNSAVSGGAIYLTDGGTLARSRFEGNAALNGGAVAALGGILTAPDLILFSNDAVAGGGVYSSGGQVNLAHSYLCDNGADRGGAFFIDALGAVTLRNSVALQNDSNGPGGVAEVQGSLVVEQSDLIGNTALTGGAVVSDGVLDIRHTLLSSNDAFAVVANGPISSDWNAWWSNAPSDVGGTLVDLDRGPNLVDTDPLLAVSLDFDCENDAFIPPVGSPLIDGGDPALSDDDGTRRDIGITGGTASGSDGDGDNVSYAFDCDDTEPTVAPGLVEVCGDGLDNDCDGAVDDCAIPTWFRDADGDGYGDAGDSVQSDTMPTGYVADGSDCDDAVASVNPGAVEACNGADDDCNGGVDDGLPVSSHYGDSDMDGFGAGPATPQCGPINGLVADDTDCDDTNAAVNPGEIDICNGVDDDCSGVIDDGPGDLTWYPDLDGDGFGAGDGVVACAPPSGTVDNDLDCDDTVFEVNPDAEEVWYDGIDDDCDGNDSDQDGDGFDSELVFGPDCDDLDASVFPGSGCDGTDTGDTDVPDTDTETQLSFGVGGKAPRGCGCSATSNSGVPMGALAVGLGLLGLLRRRSGHR